jgi:hypothetical protein
MAAERFVYRWPDWTVEKRESGWYLSRSATRHSRVDWRGPIGPKRVWPLMIARQLRREIAERYERQTRDRAG